MKLLTHNFLSTQFIKGVKEGYPLNLKSNSTEKKEFEFDPVMMVKLLPKMQYPVLLSTAQNIGIDVSGLPSQLPDNWKEDHDFLKKAAELALGYEIIDGELECPESGKVFKIKEGIPNMLIDREDDD
ncbi:unnamed protein product [Bursaphelenchus xylophilus]|uniref:Multifunctional methyltransferase subunit TRM112-like protein n=1 Tax=Bursaphelenchus xylophilus TaxID=6326 RepID=A0A1I7RHT9_BURXY|nr:unnamed protein product [Bursaphelenchus xylophilus]CAG9115390.1 unnamed protein product [Bursaphelenchus xylophilus]